MKQRMRHGFRDWAGSVFLCAALAVSCSGGKNAASGETSSTANRQEEHSVEQRIKKHVGKLIDVPWSEIEVSILDGVDVPGVTVFQTYWPSPKPGRPGRFGYGVATGDAIVTDRGKAMTMVLEAWKYGPERTVPPAQVAKVFGLFEGQPDAPARTFVTQSDIDQMRDEQKEVMFLPREATVDGKPAVEYWAASSEVPLWKTTAVIEPDRTVHISIEEFWD